MALVKFWLFFASSLPFLQTCDSWYAWGMSSRCYAATSHQLIHFIVRDYDTSIQRSIFTYMYTENANDLNRTSIQYHGYVFLNWIKSFISQKCNRSLFTKCTYCENEKHRVAYQTIAANMFSSYIHTVIYKYTCTKKQAISTVQLNRQ